MSAVSVIAPAEDSLATTTVADAVLPQEEVLDVFRQRIIGTLALVQCMPQKDKILAVEFWNEVSERLQDLLCGELSIREDEEDIVKAKEEDRVIADDGEETESESETTEGRDTAAGEERREGNSANDAEEEQQAEGHAESEGSKQVKTSQEEVTMTVVEVDEGVPKLQQGEGSGADSTVETAQDATTAVEVTKIVSEEVTAESTEESESDHRTKSDEQEETELTTQAILTENSEGQQVLVELPSSLTLDADSKIVVKDGGLEGIVLTVDTDANIAEVSASSVSEDKTSASKEEEWLNHAEKVTVDEYPPMLDEKANRRVNKHEDGSHEVTTKNDSQILGCPIQI